MYILRVYKDCNILHIVHGSIHTPVYNYMSAHVQHLFQCMCTCICKKILQPHVFTSILATCSRASLTNNSCRAQVEEDESGCRGSLAIENSEVVTTLENVLNKGACTCWCSAKGNVNRKKKKKFF